MARLLLAILISAMSGPMAAAAGLDCDRNCLRDTLTQYLSAMVAHKPGGLPLARGARFTENGVELELGQGLWADASRLTPYRLDMLDVRGGVAASHVVVEAGGARVLLGVRLKVVDRQIAEIETLVVRNQQEGVI